MRRIATLKYPLKAKLKTDPLPLPISIFSLYFYFRSIEPNTENG